VATEPIPTTKPEVLALVDLLSNGQADDAVAPQLYDDIVQSWAALGILTVAITESMTAGQRTLTLNPFQLTVDRFIYDNLELGQLALRELESLDPGWRNRRGTPHSYTIEALPARVLALYPAPLLASLPDLGTFGEPLGRDFPPYTAVIIGSEYRQAVPIQFELPLALLIMEREFSRESDHTDIEFAAWCKKLGGDLLKMAMGQIPG